MIRGHVDFASHSRVEGWIHSDLRPLAGATVLAFHDQLCVGGGVVEIFRQDLADAGLGNGVCGFSFPVSLDGALDPRLLEVRLDGGNMAILPPGTRPMLREDVGGDRRRAGRDASSFSWMSARGWLSQSQYDTLRLLSGFGFVHVQSPRSARPLDALGEVEHLALEAGAYLELNAFEAIQVEIRDTIGLADLSTLRTEMLADFPHVPPILALWSERPAILAIVDGSHMRVPDAIASSGTEQSFGDEELFLLNLDAVVTAPRMVVNPPFTAFIPRRPVEEGDV